MLSRSSLRILYVGSTAQQAGMRLGSHPLLASPLSMRRSYGICRSASEVLRERHPPFSAEMSNLPTTIASVESISANNSAKQKTHAGRRPTARAQRSAKEAANTGDAADTRGQCSATVCTGETGFEPEFL